MEKGLSTAGAKEWYGANYGRLQEIKKKYDPTLIFDKWYPIEPAA